LLQSSPQFHQFDGCAKELFLTACDNVLFFLVRQRCIKSNLHAKKINIKKQLVTNLHIQTAAKAVVFNRMPVIFDRMAFFYHMRQNEV
jgi:hypothetical protein